MPHAIAFDVPALLEAVEKRQTERGLSLREIGQQTGLGHHVFLRMKTRGLSVHALAVIVTWLGDTDIAPYLINSETDS